MKTAYGWLRGGLLWLTVLALVACGGGGGSTNRAPAADAGAGQVVTVGTPVTLDGSASADPDGDAITYRWTLTSAPAGSAAGLADPSSATPTFTPDKEGGYVFSLTVGDGQARSAAATVTVTAGPALPPEIVASQAEPLSGAVRLSLAGSVSGSVTWYADLGLIGGGDPADAYAVRWNTAAVANGSHLVVALIRADDGSTREVRRTLQVGNSSVAIGATVNGTTGKIHVDVRASSPFGITGVAATFDGADAGTLTVPNACSSSPCSQNNVYRFFVDGTAAGSGDHTMLVTGTDAAGGSTQVAVPVPVANAPVITLTAPSGGTFVHGTLEVSGTVVSDRPGPVTVSVSLGDVQFLQTTGPNFSGSYPLAGVAPGTYPLRIRALDSANHPGQIVRTVNVASSDAMAYPPSFVIPPGGRLLAAEGNTVLYTTGDGGVRLRDIVAGSEAPLADVTTIRHLSSWRVSDRRAYASGTGTDCVSTCIYQWQADGTVANLSNPNPHSAAANLGSGRTADQSPVPRDGYVVWVNGGAAEAGAPGQPTGRYTLYQVDTGNYTRIGAPAGAIQVGNSEYDFAVVGGAIHFYFWAQTGTDGVHQVIDIFKWTSDTGTSTRLTQGDGRHFYPQTDGIRAAWRQTPASASAGGTYALLTQPLAGGVPLSLSAHADAFTLRDGVAAWIDGNTTSTVLKASAAGATTTLTSASRATLLATGSGFAVYGEQSKIYAWKGATGERTLMADATLQQAIVSGGALIFAVSENAIADPREGPIYRTLVYRVPLH